MSEAGANPLERLPESRNLPTPLASREGKVERLVSVYLRTLTSPQTIKTYNTEIRMFLWFVGEELGCRLEEVTVEDLSLYREHLLKAYAPATAAKKLTTLRRFLTFTYMSGATRINPEALRVLAGLGQGPEDKGCTRLTRALAIGTALRPPQRAQPYLPRRRPQTALRLPRRGR